MKKLLSFISVAFLMSVLFSTIFGCSIVYPFAGITVISYLVHDFVPKGSFSIMAFTAPGGVATPFTFPLKFIPQFLTFNNVVPLTSLQVSTKEDGVIQQYNAASITAINGYMCKGVLPATNVLLRLATGDVPNRDVTISGVTSAAGAINFFVSSDNNSPNARAMRVTTTNILALTPTIFENFTALFIPALAAGTDKVEVEYIAKTGQPSHRQIYENQEIQALSALYQETAGIIINNIDSYISRVWVTPLAATPAYMLSVIL